jgi:hypothetical protein
MCSPSSQTPNPRKPGEPRKAVAAVLLALDASDPTLGLARWASQELLGLC